MFFSSSSRTKQSTQTILIKCALSSILTRSLYTRKLLFIAFGTLIDKDGIEIIPRKGVLNGGTPILVVGEHFFDTSSVFCSFDSKVVQGRWLSYSEIECISPSRSESGFVKFSVSFNDVNSTAPTLFEYYQNPRILEFVPANIPSIGGVEATLLLTDGHISSSDELVCRFGFQSVSGNFVNSSALACKVPPGQAGTKASVQLSRNGGYDFTTDETGAISFAYFSLPVVTSVTPLLGSSRGGTMLRILGNNFGSNREEVKSRLKCRFGSEYMSEVTYVSREEIQCYTPKGTPTQIIEVDVIVMLNKSSYATFATTFVYHEDAIIASVYPNEGSLSGGNVVTIKGQNFIGSDALLCRFGNENVKAVFVTNSEIICVVPPHVSEEQVLVNISIDGSIFTNSRFFYRYVYAQPNEVNPKPTLLVDDVYPKFCMRSKTSFITLKVQNMEASREYFCLFDSMSVTPVTINGTHLTCVCPVDIKGISVNLAIHSDVYTGTEVTKGLSIAYFDEMILEYIDSQEASVYDIELFPLVVIGDNFMKSSDLICNFGKNNLVPAQWISKFQIECLRNSSAPLERLHVELARENMNFKSNELYFPLKTGQTVKQVYQSRDRKHIIVVGGFDVSQQWICAFEDIHSEPSRQSVKEIACEIPVRFYGSTFLFRVFRDSKVIMHASTIFADAPLLVKNVWPLYGKISGGTVIEFEILGIIDSSARCLLGDKPTPVYPTESKNKYFCMSPTQPHGGFVNFSISLGDEATPIIINLQYEYIEDLFLTGIQPSSVSFGEQRMAVINGSNFRKEKNLSCVFDGILSHARWKSTSEVWCIIPKLDIGSKKVSLMYGNNETSVNRLSVEIRSFLSLTSVTPDHGTAGQAILVCGSNINWDSNLFCHFASTVTRGEKQSKSCIKCVVPELDEVGQVAISLSYNGVDKISLIMSFWYEDPPTIRTVFPLFINRKDVDTKVKIEGNNLSFLHQATCNVGAASGRITLLSKSQLTCQFQQFEKTGKYLLEIKNSNTSFVKSMSEITIFESPDIWSLYPNWIYEMESNTLLVQGSNFIDYNFTCAIDTSGMISVIKSAVIDSNHATCVLPPLKIGKYKLFVSNDGFWMSESYKLLNVVNKIGIYSCFPQSGIPLTVLNMIGSFGYSQINCRFGDTNIVQARVVNTTFAECVIPPQMSEGYFDIGFEVDGQSIESQKPFKFHVKSISVAGIEPLFGSIEGGTPVQVLLEQGLASDITHCRFNGKLVTATAMQNNTKILTCVSPSVKIPGVVTLEVSSNGIDSTSSHNLFQYVQKPVLFGIYPPSGSDIGGTKIMVEGTDFVQTADWRCLFNEVSVLAYWLSDTELYCFTVGLRPGTYQFRLSLNGIDKNSQSISYRVHQGTHIDKMFASYGSVNSVSIRKVVIFGTNFLFSKNLSCRYGNSTIKAAFISSEQLWCWTPDHSENTETLSLSINGVDYKSSHNYDDKAPDEYVYFQKQIRNVDTKTDAVTFVDDNLQHEMIHHLFDIIVHDIIPSTVLVQNPTYIGILGTNFGIRRKLDCNLLGAVIPARVVNTTFAECVIPPQMSEGYFDIGFEVDGQSIESQKPFKFHVKSISVAGIEPLFGSIEGGTPVQVLLEQGLASDITHCRFNGKLVTATAMQNNTKILTCVSPSVKIPGVVTLEVSSNGIDSTSSHNLFQYVQKPVLFGIYPPSGSDIGGTKIMVEGTDFVQTADWRCLFNEVSVLAYWLSDTELYCFTVGLRPGTYQFRLSLNKIESEGITFLCHAVPLLSTLSYSSSFVGLGKDIAIFEGVNLIHSKELKCKIDDETFVATFVDDNHIECIFPAHIGPQLIKLLEFSFANNKYNHNFQITRSPRPTILSIDTSAGKSTNSPITIIRFDYPGYISRSLCNFDGHIVAARLIDRNILGCVNPLSRNLVTSDVQLTISVDNAASWSKPRLFIPTTSVKISYVQPIQGPSQSSIIVSIYGNFFPSASEYTCHFGRIKSPHTIRISDEEIRCRTPNHPPGMVPLSLSRNNIEILNHTNYTFFTDPQIRSINPSSGVYSHDTVIRLSGQHFYYSKHVHCVFGHLDVPVTIIGTNVLTCKVPLDIVDSKTPLQIVDTSSQLQWFQSFFKYFKEPLITGLSQRYIAISDSNKIKLLGEGLNQTGDIWCRISSGQFTTLVVKGTELNENSATCEVTLPVTANRFVNIDVSNNGVNWSQRRFSLEYITQPLFLQSLPSHATTVGGSTITIKGSGFYNKGSLKCVFGNKSTQGTKITDSEIRCTSPKVEKPSVFNISLQFGNRKAIDTGLKLSLIKNCSFNSIQPISGIYHGGTPTVFKGSFSGPFPQIIFCHFGNKTVSGTVIDSKTVGCISPPMKKGVYFVDLTLTDSLGPSCSNEENLQFSYVSEHPSILAVLPNKVPRATTAMISFLGKKFVNNTGMQCTFGAYRTNASFVSTKNVSCEIPKIDQRGTIPVGLSGHDLNTEILQSTIEIIEDCIVIAAIPRSLYKGFDQLIEVKGRNFDNSPNLVCHFGPEYPTSNATWISSSEIQCRSPPTNHSVHNTLHIAVSNNGGYHLSSYLEIELLQPLQILSTTPLHGFTSGGDEVIMVVQSINLSMEVFCKFGSSLIHSSIYSNEAKSAIKCKSPRHTEGIIALSLQIGTYTVKIGSYKYTNEPSIRGIHPIHGLISGGTLVSIEGSNFIDITDCCFTFFHQANSEITLSRVLAANSSHVQCKTPKVVDKEVLEIKVGVKSSGKTIFNDYFVFSYRNTPRIFSTSINSGPESGGTNVIIYGENFIDSFDFMCRFGSKEVEAFFISTTEGSCFSPKLIGIKPLSISTNGVDFIHSDIDFHFYPISIVKKIEPDFGSVHGGTPVFIQLNNGQALGQVKCRFGSNIAPGVFLDAKKIVCYSPKVVVAAKEVIEVSFNGQDFHGCENSCLFEYLPTIMVKSISPSIASVDEIDVDVEVEVENMRNKSSIICYFGQKTPVVPSKIKNNTVVCKAPKPSKWGASNLQVSVSYDIVSDEKKFVGPIFQYIEQPTMVLNVLPSFGSIAGGTMLILDGINFPFNSLKCRLGDQDVEAIYVNKSQIRCVTPEVHHVHRTTLEVVSNDIVISSAYFDYIRLHSIHSNYPTYGSSNGGTQVTVKGNNFSVRAPKLLLCRFGSEVVSASYVNINEIRCITPPKAPSIHFRETLLIDVSLNGVDFIRGDNVTFVYSSPLSIVKIHPNFGPTHGGSNIQISVMASSLYHLDSFFCHFNKMVVNGTLVSRGDDIVVVACTSPLVNQRGSVNVEISVNSRNDVTTNEKAFFYYEVPNIAHIRPKSGFASGGSHVNLQGNGFVQNEQMSCRFGDRLSPKIIYVSSTSVICVSPPLMPNDAQLEVPVTVANNGFDFIETNLTYIYRYNPSAFEISPRTVYSDGSTLCEIKGKHLVGAKTCRFGDFGESVPVLSNSKNLILCRPPKVPWESPYYHTHASVYVEFEQDFVFMKLSVFYQHAILPVKTFYDSMEITKKHPIVLSLQPPFSTSNGNQQILVKGQNFVNGQGLSCMFGTRIKVPAQYISSTTISCLSPRTIPSILFVNIVNGGSRLWSKYGAKFQVLNDIMIDRVTPAFGPLYGGTKVLVSGNFLNVLVHEEIKYTCSFGHINVPATLLDQFSLLCLSPPGLETDVVQFRVSANGGQTFSHSFAWFRYMHSPMIYTVSPNHGDVRGGYFILVRGKHFEETIDIGCRFGTHVASKSYFISSTEFLCFAPSQPRAARVTLELTFNGLDYTHSRSLFHYHDSLHILDIKPSMTPSMIVGPTIYLSGTGFSPNFKMFCIIAHSWTEAKFIKNDTISCKVAQTLARGMKAIKVIGDAKVFESNTVMHEFYAAPLITLTHSPSTNIQGGASLFIRGTHFRNFTSFSCQFNNDVKSQAIYIQKNMAVCSLPPTIRERNIFVKLSPSGVDTEFHRSFGLVFQGSCDYGKYCSYSLVSSILSAPNGTYAISQNEHNMTLCKPGSFAPKSGLSECLSCPVSYFCPDFGMSKPLICPSGEVCDRTGLISPSNSCPSGHYCNFGTKTMSPFTFTTNHDWNINIHSGKVVQNLDESLWKKSKRQLPATGSSTVDHIPANKNLLAEQPIPCPLGYYCMSGVSTNVSMAANFSTPQACINGYFCPRGSSVPQGSGPCPTGNFCPTVSLAIICPIGHYCPGVGNIEPLRCYPGSFAPIQGMSNCLPCEIGHVCPSIGLSRPELCPEGFVCDTNGLSVAFKTCPPGFFCDNGTKSLDPNQAKGPISCPAGVFCLGGIAHNKTIDWVPNQEEGKVSPQTCNEGYYCEASSSTPEGSGPCFPGHFCPPGTAYPIQVPVGNFADEGAIAPMLCFPGTYTANTGLSSCKLCPSGHSCKGYGTYIPRICEVGTYRSKADSITCKLCPPGTFSPYRGASDITQCLPCPPGLVCEKKGMVSLAHSEKCEGGFICSSSTDKRNQYSQKCAGGHACGEGTNPKEQFQNVCDSGCYCPRGTSSSTKQKYRCDKSQFCPFGSSTSKSSSNQCPRQTTSVMGASTIRSCNILPVDVCDKVDISTRDPSERQSYYPTHSYSLIDSNKTVTISSNELKSLLGEVRVLQKVNPVDQFRSTLTWVNDTIQVIRACPKYTILSRENYVTPDQVIVVGRNFQNTTNLTCRFRMVTLEGSMWERRNPGTFVSNERIMCVLPQDKMGLEKNSIELQESKLSCAIDNDDRVYYRRYCKRDDDPNCVGSVLNNDRHERFYSLYIPCTHTEIEKDQCQNLPSIGSALNPCFSTKIIVDVSNNGAKFSSNFSSNELQSHTIDGELDISSSQTVHDVVVIARSKIFSGLVNGDFFQSLKTLHHNHFHFCTRKIAQEETRRNTETDLFIIPFMSEAKVSLDWSHLSSKIKYGEHFKLALYVRPSRCIDSYCSSRRVRQPDKENNPCVRPIELPQWFEDSSVNKHQQMNLTILALDDVVMKAEVQILHGLFSPFADTYLRSISVQMINPLRGKIPSDKQIETNTVESRPMSHLISWEEKRLTMEFIFVTRLTSYETRIVSPPLNLPPRWSKYETGRVLVSMNTTHASSVPTIKDGFASSKSNTFWDNPFASPQVAKEKTDAYFETFHGLFLNGEDNHQYKMDSLMLPYIPYFSNCREFDSYIPFSLAIESRDCKLPEIEERFPAHWWRRTFSSLPHRDFMQAIGPFDFNIFYPIADWCERKIHCEYEERLHEKDITPRWFEAESGTTLYSLIRDPVNYSQYTGRSGSRSEKNDGGGSKFMKSIKVSDTFVPVKVKRIGNGNNCSTLCFPRKISLEIAYHQVNKTDKRIIDAVIVYDQFDKDFNDSKYEVDMKFYPLNYQQLIVKFAFNRDVFLLLFILIGVLTILMSFLHWCLVRLTTQIKNPPDLRIGAMLWLIFPQAISGYTLGMIPILTVTGGLIVLLKDMSSLSMIQDNIMLFNLPLFNQVRLHYTDLSIDPAAQRLTQQGRLGTAFFYFALVSIVEGSKLFVPRRISTRERNLDEQRDNDAKKKKIWNLVTWKRSNLILCSFFMGLLSTIIVEFSYWASFGKYIWEIIIVLKILDNVIGYLIDKQMGEALLSAPIMAAMGLIQSIVTLSANDFLDFLLSYIVGFGFLILERMYISPTLSQMIDEILAKLNTIVSSLHSSLKKLWRMLIKGDTNGNLTEKRLEEDSSNTIGAVEPIIESYGSYCLETLSLLYLPYAILLLMIFRDDTEMATRYGIKEQDMEYYVSFALIIIPFQFISDAFLHTSLELFHGWKIYDYLVYTRYRFLQRETKWKGFEDSLDECIDENVRSLDHMCFSSQFYMMTTIHVNGIIYMVLGIQMMSRANYNLFGDPAMPMILAIVTIISISLKKILLFIGWSLSIWKIRHENTAWHVKIAEDEALELPDWDDIRGASIDAFEMNKRISSESFRYKFVNYNRTWLIDQLPNILTPRTLRRSKPFITNQLARVIHKLNSDSSSDGDNDDLIRQFITPNVTPSSKSLMQLWMEEAQRRMRLKECVQPLIERERSTHCERCLCRKLLKVQTVSNIKEMYVNIVHITLFKSNTIN